MNVTELKIELSCLGLRLESIPAGARMGGAGPSEGLTLFVDEHALSVPVQSPYVARSPYRLGRDDAGYVIYKNDRAVTHVEIPELPQVYADTFDDLELSKIALLHGRDCLGSTVVQKCLHQEQGRKCAFCGLGLSLASCSTIPKKLPEQLAWAGKKLQAKHAVLTTGNWGGDAMIVEHLSNCVQSLAGVDIPAQVQLCPPRNLDLIERLHNAGAAAIAMNLESFDPAILARVAPAKALLGWEHYKAAFERAVAVFGRNRVISFIIAGLGETDSSILDGVEALSELGVYPFLLPLRPVPGTEMADEIPPAPDRMKTLYEASAKIVQAAGLSWRDIPAGCGRCEACSALPEAEDDLVLGLSHVSTAIRPSEIRACIQLRQEVFVRELGISGLDAPDEQDSSATHLYYMDRGLISGTVRVHKENGDYWGSRLAVGQGRRSGKGASLVRAAEDQVRRLGGKRILGKIQEQQVPFFSKLGWKGQGDPFDYHGIRHLIMRSREL